LYTTSAFEATPGARESQDVGFEGLNDVAESQFANYQSFINGVTTRVTDPVAQQALLADPSGDNFRYYLGGANDEQNHSILMRYKDFNGMENNSPISNNNQYTPSSSNLPDNEDLNNDNTINFDNNYYEYKIDINPERFNIGENYIISKHFNVEEGD